MSGDEFYGDDVTSGIEPPIECGQCGSTETIELHHPTEVDQSITICANCGSDE